MASTGVGVVQVGGRQLGQLVQVAVGVQVPPDDILDGGADQEVLLREPQQLAVGVVVLGVEHLGDDLAHGLLLHGPHIVAAVEELHVELVVFRLPHPQQADALAVHAGDAHVIGDGGDGGVVLVAHGVVLVVPLLLDMAAKADFHGAFGHLLQPDAAAGQPGVGQLGLPAVHQLLAEQAVFIPQGIAHGRIALGGQAVHKAGRQAAQAAVAQAGVGLLFIQIVQLDIVFRQSLAEGLLQAQVVQVVAQRAPQEELHAEIIDLLGAGFLCVLNKLRAALGQQFPHNQDAGLVIFFVGGVFQRDAEGVGQLVTNGSLICGTVIL